MISSEYNVKLNKNEELFRTLYEAIRNKELKSGTRLAPEEELARIHKCSRVTVRNSLKQLESLRLITRVRGRGTYVSGAAEKFTRRQTIAIALQKSLSSDYWDSEPYMNQLLMSLLKNGHELDFFGDFIFLDKDKTFMESIERQKIDLDLYDGIIFAVQLTPADVLALEGHHVNYVALQSPEDDRSEVSYVTIDHANGGYMGTQHLIDVGCRNIWFFCGPWEDKVNKLRFAGFCQALEENSFPEVCKQNYREITGDKQEDAAAEVEKLLNKHITFDGLFIYGDWATIGVVNMLRKHGVRIPEDVAVVMYDDFSFVEKVLGLRMTAIRQPFPEQIGYAVRILLNRLKNGNNGNLVQIIQPRLMIRDSSNIRSGRKGRI